MKKRIFTLFIFIICIFAASISLVSCFRSEEDKFVYTLSEDETYYTITGNKLGTFDREIAIPSEHEGKPVKAIANHAFYACHNIETVYIPNSVIYIGDAVFRDCKLLKSVELPDELVAFGYAVFDGCSSFNMSEYENAKYVGNKSNPYLVLVEAVHSSIPSCEIHEDTRVIASHAFYKCDELEKLVIEKNIVGIGDNAVWANKVSFVEPSGWYITEDPRVHGTEIEVNVSGKNYSGDYRTPQEENAIKLKVDYDSYYWIRTEK